MHSHRIILVHLHAQLGIALGQHFSRDLSSHSLFIHLLHLVVDDVALSARRDLRPLALLHCPVYEHDCRQGAARHSAQGPLAASRRKKSYLIVERHGCVTRPEFRAATYASLVDTYIGACIPASVASVASAAERATLVYIFIYSSVVSTNGQVPCQRLRFGVREFVTAIDAAVRNVPLERASEGAGGRKCLAQRVELAVDIDGLGKIDGRRELGQVPVCQRCVPTCLQSLFDVLLGEACRVKF